MDIHDYIGQHYRINADTVVAIRAFRDCMTAVAQPRLLPDRLARLDEYLGGYREVFSRADQARSFGLYVRGLLDGDHRKNIESIAGRLRDAKIPATDLAQSLQHFVTQSPWDAARVLQRYRSLIRPTTPKRTWVVHDGIVPKKGRYSVGVQRQFARSLGRKVNCQVAVVISEVNSNCIPLAARLYLPTQWLRENRLRAERTIPRAYCQARSKAEVALEVLDDLLGDGRPVRVLAEDGYGSALDFREGVARRGLTLAEGNGDEGELLQVARTGFETLKDGLGLSHFEGRSWVGWHHHMALVLVAFGFLVREDTTNAVAPHTLPSLPVN